MVAVCLEHRFFRVGADVYTALSFPYDYWRNYLQYFDSVTVVARVKVVEKIESNFVLASGPGVTFSDMPYYVGPYEFVKKSILMLVSAFRVVKENEQFILRSGNVSNAVWLFLMLSGKRYLREYPGNIKEGVVGVAGNGFLPLILASFLHVFAKLQSRYSVANSFVSEYCRDVYGGSNSDFVFSSFRLSEVKIRKQSFQLVCESTLTIVSVSRLEGEKGHRDLFQAMNLLAAQGISTRLNLIGDGSCRKKLEEDAKELNIGVEFMGAVTDRELVFEVLSKSDIFVLPSHTEGMPRALLEAMAVGLPCIGSRVGGVPEVLELDWMVPSSQPDALAKKIALSFNDLAWRKAGGNRNLDYVSSHFGDDGLNHKKLLFWRCLDDKESCS